MKHSKRYSVLLKSFAFSQASQLFRSSGPNMTPTQTVPRGYVPGRLKVHLNETVQNLYPHSSGQTDWNLKGSAYRRQRDYVSPFDPDFVTRSCSVLMNASRSLTLAKPASLKPLSNARSRLNNKMG